MGYHDLNRDEMNLCYLHSLVMAKLWLSADNCAYPVVQIGNQRNNKEDLR